MAEGFSHNTAVQARIPGQLGSKVQVRKGWLHCHANGPQLEAEHVCKHKLTHSVRPQKDSSVVLRLSTDARFVEHDWKKSKQQAPLAARQWCESQTAKAKAACGDTWGFEVADDWQIQGLIRITSPDIAKQLFECGGLRSNGVRWFVDYVGKPSNTRILWSPWQSPESWNDYAQRIRQQANGAIVNDGSCRRAFDT